MGTHIKPAPDCYCPDSHVGGCTQQSGIPEGAVSGVEVPLTESQWACPWPGVGEGWLMVVVFYAPTLNSFNPVRALQLMRPFLSMRIKTLQSEGASSCFEWLWCF